MTACPRCHAQPVLEQTSAGYRYGCPNRNRTHARDAGCPQWTVYWNTTPAGARKSWEHAVAPPPVPCPRCGLRGEHVCLTGDAEARDGGSQWWAGRRGSHKRYSDEEAQP